MASTASKTSFGSGSDNGSGSTHRITLDNNDRNSLQPVSQDSMSTFTEGPAEEDIGEKDTSEECFYEEEDGKEETCEDEEEEECEGEDGSDEACEGEEGDNDAEDMDGNEADYDTDEDSDEDLLLTPEEIAARRLEKETAKRLQEEQARQQEEERLLRKKLIFDKKELLVREYLRDIKNFNRLRARNFILSVKLKKFTEEKQDIVARYIKRELDDQKARQETEKLRKRQLLEACQDHRRGLGKEKAQKKANAKRRRRGSRRTNFTLSRTNFHEASDSDSAERKFPRIKAHVPNVSLTELRKVNTYNLDLLLELTETVKKVQRKQACKRLRYLRKRIQRKTIPFTFYREDFFKDVEQWRNRKRSVNLDHLDVKEKMSSKELRAAVISVSTSQSKVDSTTDKLAEVPGIDKSTDDIIKPKKRSIVDPIKTAFLRSRSRMSVDASKSQKIKLQSNRNTTKNLHMFKFEFAGPRAHQDSASSKIREDLVRLLQNRQMSTASMRWPMEVKGMEYQRKNPFGRVTLQYTRLNNHERDQPSVAYRMVLTNLAFLRTKLRRMAKEHRNNMHEMQKEREMLQTGIEVLFDEIIDGLHIMTSLCGASEFERRDAKRENDSFTEELKRIYNEFFMDNLVNMYKTISDCEFTLRKLSISEAKGEGAELHEFKEILRTRQKLIAEHKHIETEIMRHQQHSEEVCSTVRKSGKKLRGARNAVEKMNKELDEMKLALTTMINGMYKTQVALREAETKKLNLEYDAGLLCSPALADDYVKVVAKIDDVKARKMELARAYNKNVREIEKIAYPAKAKPLRYKLRS